MFVVASFAVTQQLLINVLLQLSSCSRICLLLFNTSIGFVVLFIRKNLILYGFLFVDMLLVFVCF